MYTLMACVPDIDPRRRTGCPAPGRCSLSGGPSHGTHGGIRTAVMRPLRTSLPFVLVVLPALVLQSLLLMFVSIRPAYSIPYSSAWTHFAPPLRFAAAWSLDVHDNRYGVCVWSTHAPACVVPPVCQTITPNNSSGSVNNTNSDTAYIRSSTRSAFDSSSSAQPSPVRFTQAALAESRMLPSQYTFARAAVCDTNMSGAHHANGNGLARMQVDYDGGGGMLSARCMPQAPLYLQFTHLAPDERVSDTLHKTGSSTIMPDQFVNTSAPVSVREGVTLDETTEMQQVVNMLNMSYEVIKISIRRMAAHRWSSSAASCVNQSSAAHCTDDSPANPCMEVDVHLIRLQPAPSFSATETVRRHNNRRKDQENRSDDVNNRASHTVDGADDADSDKMSTKSIGSSSSSGSEQIVKKESNALPTYGSRCEQASLWRLPPDLILSIRLEPDSAMVLDKEKSEHSAVLLSDSAIESLLRLIERSSADAGLYPDSSLTLSLPRNLPFLATQGGTFRSSFVYYSGSVFEPPCTTHVGRVVTQQAVYIHHALWERVALATVRSMKTSSGLPGETFHDLTHACRPHTRLFRGMLHTAMMAEENADKDARRVRNATTSPSTSPDRHADVTAAESFAATSQQSSTSSVPITVTVLVSINAILFTYLVVLLFARYECIGWPTMLGGLNHPVQFYERAFEELDSLGMTDLDAAPLTQ